MPFRSRLRCAALDFHLAVRLRDPAPFCVRPPPIHHLLSLPSTILAGAFLLTACAKPALHVDPGPIITDRPDFTESAVTIPLGFTQSEMGSTYTREDGVRSISTGETLFRVGVARRVELRITAPTYTFERSAAGNAEGLEDAGLGVKIALHDGPEQPGSAEPTVAVIVGLSLPSGARPFRSRGALPEVKFLAAWNLTERVSFGSNINWARTEDAGSAYSEWSGSGTFGLALSERAGVFVEYFAFGGGQAAWQRREYVNSGLTYLLGSSTQLDARAGVRVRDPGKGVFFGVGVSRRF